MDNKILIFDLIGTMAHFRRFYTNSSSLSYAFPPRTTIIGMLAGILGFERDTYYERFGVKNCRIALAIRHPIRKLVQTINYIRTKNINEITGSGGHTQIPVEFLLPSKTDTLRYRVFLYCIDDELYNELLQRIRGGSFEYPVYLGITECPGEIDFFVESRIEKLNNSDKQPFEISSVIPVHKIEAFPELIQGFRYLKEDRVPVEFNSERSLTKVSGYIFEQNCNKVRVKIKKEYIEDVIKLYYYEACSEERKEITEYIIFMD